MKIEHNHGIITRVTGVSGHVELPAEIDGFKIVSIGQCALCDSTDITSVTIPYGVASIEAWAFGNCHKLTSVTIPDSVKFIGHRAFECCTRLASVIIPDSVIRIDELAFEPWTSLTWKGVNCCMIHGVGVVVDGSHTQNS